LLLLDWFYWDCRLVFTSY